LQAELNSVASYYLLALGISWAGWLPFAASQAGLLRYQVPVELPILTQFGPTLAAIIVTGLKNGGPGVRKLLARILQWRIPLRWFVVPILLAPAIGLAILIVHRALGQETPSLSAFFLWYTSYPAALRGTGPYGLEQTVPPSIGLITALANFAARGPWQSLATFLFFAVATGPLSEEFGWRGFALPALQARHSALAASIRVGLLWGFWHTGPDFWRLLLSGNPLALLYPLVMTCGTLPLSVVSTWLFNSASGSLLPSVLFHAAFNSTLYILSLVWTTRSTPAITVELGAAMWIVAGVIVLAFGPARLAGTS
jgi:membrane protease YdiL (CAAX protease family)